MLELGMTFSKTIVVITEDPIAAAMLSFDTTVEGKYVTVLEPPRMARPDASNEVARVLNVIRRIRPQLTIMIGVEKSAVEQIEAQLRGRVLSVDTIDEFEDFPVDLKTWKQLSVDQAVDKLLTEKGSIQIPVKAVVYNGKADVGYVIAANYAILHKAKLIRFETPANLERDVVQRLNVIDSIKDNDIRHIDISSLVNLLKSYLPKELVDHNFYKTLLITPGIPYGLLWPEKKVIYASNLMLGAFFSHNIFEAEWGRHERLGLIGLYVADRAVEWPGEFKSFQEAVLRGRGLTKKKITNHPKLTELDILTIPYDILYIATHGKQLDGFLETYEVPIDGSDHSVTIKKASGLVSMVGFIEAVDGIEHTSDEWSINEGKIWAKFSEHYLQHENKLPEPISSEPCKLEMRSLVLGHEPGMNSPFSVQRLASDQRPIVIANACGSWTDMSTLFLFANASAYIGTLWETVSSTAYKFADVLNDGIFAKPLDQSFFDARDSLDSDLDRMNYVYSGSFENKYDSNAPFTSNGLIELRERLNKLLLRTRYNIKHFPADIPADIKNNAEIDEMWYLKNLKEINQSSGKSASRKVIKKNRKDVRRKRKQGRK